MMDNTWSEERVEMLKRLWAEGLSASQIAGEMGGGITRNAVIGKVHRLGLSGRAKSPGASASATPRQSQPRKAAASSSHAPVARAVSRGSAALAPRPVVDYALETEIVALAPDDVVIPFSERVTIMELKEGMCRWPMGDPTKTEFRFCGAKCGIGTPYCGHHARIAYQPSADRRKDRRLLRA